MPAERPVPPAAGREPGVQKSPTAAASESFSVGTHLDTSMVLLVLLDCNVYSWQNFHSVVDQMCMFLNLYLALSHDNRVVVVGACNGSSRYLYPTLKSSSKLVSSVHIKAGAYKPFRDLSTSIIANITAWLHEEIPECASESTQNSGPLTGQRKRKLNTNNGTAVSHSECDVSAALSRLLAYANKLQREGTMSKMRCRVLVFSASEDCPTSYVNLMNGIFSAQKMGVVIDVCRVVTSKSDSSFLQQAAFLTSGVYICVNTTQHSTNLIQHLIHSFLPHPQILRPLLRQPPPASVDFRAACLCHNDVINIGYVCNVCLAIYCQRHSECQTCMIKKEL